MHENVSNETILCFVNVKETYLCDVIKGGGAYVYFSPEFIYLIVDCAAKLANKGENFSLYHNKHRKKMVLIVRIIGVYILRVNLLFYFYFFFLGMVCHVLFFVFAQDKKKIRKK